MDPIAAQGPQQLSFINAAVEQQALRRLVKIAVPARPSAQTFRLAADMRHNPGLCSL